MKTISLNFILGLVPLLSFGSAVALNSAHAEDKMIECTPRYTYVQTANGWSDRVLDFKDTKRGCFKKKEEVEKKDGVYYVFSKGYAKSYYNPKTKEERVWFFLLESGPRLDRE